MAMNAYLKFVKKMWYAPLVWAGAIIVLVFRFLWSLLRSAPAHLLITALRRLLKAEYLCIV